jgi:hypothetical protein
MGEPAVCGEIWGERHYCVAAEAPVACAILAVLTMPSRSVNHHHARGLLHPDAFCCFPRLEHGSSRAAIRIPLAMC